jgi:hypothetical protein
MTHNRPWGADSTAHIHSFIFPDEGYAVKKGLDLSPEIIPLLYGILTAAGMDGGTATALAGAIAPELGHDLAETAVDLLVKRNLDRAVGARMILAAELRPPGAGQLPATACAGDLMNATGMPLTDATALIVGEEQQYREYIVQYGTAFSLPEKQTIALLAQQTAPVAEMYISLGEQVTTLFEGGATAGDQEVRWNASGQASGVYLYRIEAGPFSSTRRMILLK